MYLVSNLAQSPRRDLSVLAAYGLVATACLALAGCHSDYKLVKVSGTVTLRGKPISGVEVRFQPMTSGNNINPGPGSMGVSGTDGRYVLVVQDASLKPGAVVGKHMVFLSTAVPPADPKSDAPSPQPLYYRSETFEVPAHSIDIADFALMSEPGGTFTEPRAGWLQACLTGTYFLF